MRYARQLTLFISIVCLTNVAQSAIVGSGSYITASGEAQLEAWLGSGDLDFVTISDLEFGASAYFWHSLVDGYTNTISIYEVMYGGVTHFIGGYNAYSFGGLGYQHSGAVESNFIFNLGLGLYGANEPSYTAFYDLYTNPDYFATFGGGHDLFGGTNVLGSSLGYSNSGQYLPGCYGYSYCFQGTNIFGNNLATSLQFSVRGLETYVYRTAASVPAPASLTLVGLGLAGLGWSRRKKV